MIKKTLFYAVCCWALLPLCSCGGDSTEPEPAPDPPGVETYTLSSDFTSVRVNQNVTFTVTDSQGRDVTSAWNICDESGCRQSNVFGWDMPGTYVVTAHSKEDSLDAGNQLSIQVLGTVYTLHADPEVVETDQPVRFTVTALKNGTQQSDATSEFTIGVKDGESYTGHTHIFQTKGVYTIQAFKHSDTSVKTLNSVEIIVKDRTQGDLSDRFYRRSLLAEGSGTSCWSCPAMARGIEFVMENLLPERIVPVAFHQEGDALQVTDPLSGYFMSFFSDYGLQAYPYSIVDWNKLYASADPMNNVDTSGPVLVHSVESSQARYELTPGLAVATTLTGRVLKVSVKLTPREAATYSLGVLMLEDGIETEQTGATNNRMVQMNVAQLQLTSSLAESLGTLTKDAEKTYEYTVTVPDRHVLANCRVVAYVNKSDATIQPFGYFCANTVTVKAGKSVAYQYEEVK